MKVQDREVESIVPYEGNPRNIPEEAVEKVAASIREFGFQQPIVVDKDGVIIVGHTRLEAAKRLGLKKVPVIVASELSPEKVRAYRLADNKTNEFSSWNEEKLFHELEAITLDMEPFGFENLTSLLEGEDPEPQEDDFDIDEVSDETNIKPGDMFRLGEHILLCGDSTVEADVEKLVGGGCCQMAITDPPYNVDYTGFTEDRMKIMNDSMAMSSFVDFLSSAFRNMKKCMKPGAAYYIWFATRSHIAFETALKESELDVRQELIWNKNTFTLGRQDYQWKHEPCFYGWKEGAAHEWCSDRKQSTVLDFDKPQRNGEHPTMKPVKLIAYLISNSSRKGDSVLDLFGGSGTTLIACEQLGRKCYVMELDPHYCQVIIDRWEAFTGQKAEKIA